MKKLLLFAGTTEGRRLAQDLAGRGWQITACTATEYGAELMKPAPGLILRAGRLDQAGMENLLAEGGFSCAVDATHPYAREATENIRRACLARGVPCLRLLRPASAGLEKGVLWAKDAAEAAQTLCGLPGNVLLTTGSKELEIFTQVTDYQSRVYVRILPVGEAVERAASLGFARGHIIAMQGPFSLALNRAMLEQYQIKTMVAKDGGGPSGFEDRRQAAEQAGAALLVVRRPPEAENAMDYGQVLARLLEWRE